jgi:hypothetical protein
MNPCISDYACTICWYIQIVHKETSAVEMKKYCYRCHSIPARRCLDLFTVSISKMIVKDISLAAAMNSDAGVHEHVIRGSYQLIKIRDFVRSRSE